MLGIVLLVCAACGYVGAEIEPDSPQAAVTSPYPVGSIHNSDRVTIEFWGDASDSYSVTIIDPYAISYAISSGIYSVFLAASFQDTSEPMQFPRFAITFWDGALDAFTMHVDENNVFSLRGAGNYAPFGGTDFFLHIDELFRAHLGE